MDVLRPLSTGVSTSGGTPVGARARALDPRHPPLRAMHQHPGSIPLYLIKTTNTPSTLNQHPFVPIESPRIHQDRRAKDARLSDAISSTGGPSGGRGGEKGGREEFEERSP